ncbi:hypothetical protein [Streptomyces sp. ISL-94]|uniref:hypothetical protein n=1 Tax=Streptomyces sp. ISL-94 TaxID=2819190 RepID=UPI002035520F|nr:hypothetical protein [Streptomyces sp. ISL-94]
MFDEAGRNGVRKQFRRLGWIMRLLAFFGRSARMSPEESAEVVIELDALSGELGQDFAALRCPVVFVVGSGGHPGASEQETGTMRAAVAEATAGNDRVTVFGTSRSNHMQILAKDPDIVAAAIADVIGLSARSTRR